MMGADPPCRYAVDLAGIQVDAYIRNQRLQCGGRAHAWTCDCLWTRECLDPMAIDTPRAYLGDATAMNLEPTHVPSLGVVLCVCGVCKE